MSNYSSGVGSGIGAGLSLGGIGQGINVQKAVDQEMVEADEDEIYEPNEKEIIGYAEFLGMDPEVDKEFLYIAIEGLSAPVPEPWVTK